MMLHGNTWVHDPLKARVPAAMAMWGVAKVRRNGELVKTKAPIHIMLTSDVRGENFNYKCYNCTANEIEEVHLILSLRQMPSLIRRRAVFCTLMWEQSDWTVEPAE